ncbi:MAG: pyridoxamine 5'-phosphate oxidase family protein [Acetobacteraceae bacterium]
MAQFFDHIPEALQDFIRRQHVFFTASVSGDSRINLSPKGSDCMRVLGAKQVVYLDQTGSGNETAAHVRSDGRLTIMFCAFEGAPMILRLYGRGRVLPRGSADYAALLSGPFAGNEPPGARQMIVLDVESVQTSCGFSVPLMEFQQDRETLKNWAERKGEDGIRDYWQAKNVRTIDGLPTGMAQDLGIAAE